MSGKFSLQPTLKVNRLVEILQASNFDHFVSEDETMRTAFRIADKLSGVLDYGEVDQFVRIVLNPANPQTTPERTAAIREALGEEKWQQCEPLLRVLGMPDYLVPPTESASRRKTPTVLDYDGSWSPGAVIEVGTAPVKQLYRVSASQHALNWPQELPDPPNLQDDVIDARPPVTTPLCLPPFAQGGNRRLVESGFVDGLAIPAQTFGGMNVTTADCLLFTPKMDRAPVLAVGSFTLGQPRGLLKRLALIVGVDGNRDRIAQELQQIQQQNMDYQCVVAVRRDAVAYGQSVGDFLDFLENEAGYDLGKVTVYEGIGPAMNIGVRADGSWGEARWVTDSNGEWVINRPVQSVQLVNQ